MENKTLKDFTPQKDGSANLFGNRYLDLLTRTSPWIIIPLDAVLIALMLFIGARYMGVDLAANWWLYPVGLFSWTFLEYIMHRFAFHFESKRESGKKAVYAIHLIHHHYPNDDQRLFQPPLVNILLASVFLGVGYLAMGKNAFVFIPGLVNGYVLYSFMHYSMHMFKPPFKFLQPLWRHHHLHHYRFQTKAFGVSSPFWDYIFGTMPPKELKK